VLAVGLLALWPGVQAASRASERAASKAAPDASSMKPASSAGAKSAAVSSATRPASSSGAKAPSSRTLATARGSDAGSGKSLADKSGQPRSRGKSSGAIVAASVSTAAVGGATTRPTIAPAALAPTTSARAADASADPLAPLLTVAPAGASRLRSGCAHQDTTIASLLDQLNVQDQSFASFLALNPPDIHEPSSSACWPYAVSIDADNRVQALSVVRTARSDGAPVLINIDRAASDGGFAVRADPTAELALRHRTIDLTVEQISAGPSNEMNELLPRHSVRAIQVLTREIGERSRLQPQSQVRVTIDQTGVPGQVKLVGIRYLDRTGSSELAHALWVERQDMPGGFFTASGAELEKVFWSTPLDQMNISRGVGIVSSTRAVSQVGYKDKGRKKVVTTRYFTHYREHQGIDFAAPTGTPIHAVADATVAFSGWMGGYGNLVILEHAGGYRTYYAHLSAFAPGMEPGTGVGRGQEIGSVGSTGQSTGPHLHFELRKNGRYVNPMAVNRDLDLWVLRDQDRTRLTRQAALLTALAERP
jgi:murein DD-endopeptidase MepM/ murein hydrolase activator NlpD